MIHVWIGGYPFCLLNFSFIVRNFVIYLKYVTGYMYSTTGEVLQIERLILLLHNTHCIHALRYQPDTHCIHVLTYPPNTHCIHVLRYQPNTLYTRRDVPEVSKFTTWSFMTFVSLYGVYGDKNVKSLLPEESSECSHQNLRTQVCNTRNLNLFWKF